jgi:hypothetical protein
MKEESGIRQMKWPNMEGDKNSTTERGKSPKVDDRKRTITPTSPTHAKLYLQERVPPPSGAELSTSIEPVVRSDHDTYTCEPLLHMSKEREMIREITRSNTGCISLRAPPANPIERAYDVRYDRDDENERAVRK